MLTVVWACVCCKPFSDNDDVTDGPNENKVSRVVKKLTLENGESYSFDYDAAGRLSGYYVLYDEGSYHYTISYEDAGIRFTNKYEGDTNGCLFKLGEGGYASKIMFFHGEDYGEADNLYYNDGYLCRMDDGDRVIDDITYSDGNCRYYAGDYMEYTSFPNDYSIDFNNFWVLMPVEVYTFVRLAGITSRNLIGLSQHDGFRRSFDYAFDDFGRVKTITCTNSEGYVSVVTVEYYD